MSASGAGTHEKPGIVGRLHEELRSYAVIAGYLYVCLGAIIVYKTALLRGEGVEYLPVGFAAVKALILGKFVLLGKAARLGESGKPHTVGHRIIRKTLLFAVFLLLLSLMEELVSGWWHGRPLAATIAEFGGDPLLQLVADSFLLVLIVLPLVAVLEVSAALGPGVLRGLLTSRSR